MDDAFAKKFDSLYMISTQINKSSQLKKFRCCFMTFWMSDLYLMLKLQVLNDLILGLALYAFRKYRTCFPILLCTTIYMDWC
jgi:hypothetical protein